MSNLFVNTIQPFTGSAVTIISASLQGLSEVSQSLVIAIDLPTGQLTAMNTSSFSGPAGPPGPSGSTTTIEYDFDTKILDVNNQKNIFGSMCEGLPVISIINTGSLTAIAGNAFSGGGVSGSYNFPNVKIIGGGAFQSNTQLNNITANSCSFLSGNSVFNSCTNLISASFNIITSIPTSTFQNCTSLVSVTFPNATIISSSAFQSCTSLVFIPFDNVTSIGNSAFQSCTSLQTASFNNATSVGANAFQSCTSLQTASFDSATVISSSAFFGCTSLQTALFNNATSIGTNAFQNCTNLQTASFNNVTSIGNSAFQSCTSLQTASFNNATSIGTNAFNSCFEISSSGYNFGNYTGSLGGSSFRNNRNIVNANFVSGSKTVGAGTGAGGNAFSNCISLVSASFPNALTIGVQAFIDCSSLGFVSFPSLSGSTALGGSTGNSFVFAGSVPNSGSATFPSFLTSSNAGSPDGDIIVLQNKGWTVNFV